MPLEISPVFIVRSARETIAFYQDALGFEVVFQVPAQDPFFAILHRDGAQLFVKEVGVDPVPNPTCHRDARLDAFVYTPDPDALAAEFEQRRAKFHTPLGDTHDDLRGFEIQDPNGYVLFFGRPIQR
jgi:catechol 2,3-dioxygenase-like lactoylglutathione lyase family enzyme